MTTNLKTTVGGLIALAAVGLLMFHQIEVTNAMELLGVAATWIGIASQDAGKGK
jgi:hypothetical protein